MLLLLKSLGTAVGIALASLVVGRALLLLVGPRWARGRSPENFALASLLGTVAIALGGGWLSRLGLPAPAAGRILIGAGAVLAALAAARRGARAFHRPTLALASAGLALVVLAGMAITLHPLWYGGFHPFNDTFSYVSIAEWLQCHGFGEECPPDPERPILGAVTEYQKSALRMGSTHLLALVRAAQPRDSALELFPAVSAWGVGVNLLAIFLLCRWACRVPRPYAVAAAGLAVATVNPLTFSAHAGFQPQVYGTALLVLLFALLARSLSPVRWTPRDAWLPALAGAGLVSVYSELAPVAGLAAGGFLLAVAWRAARGQRFGRLARYLSCAIAFALVLGNSDWVRMAKAVRGQLKAVVGYPIEWPAEGLTAFALGTTPFRFPDVQLTWWSGVAAGLAGLVFVLGLARCASDRRGRVGVVALVVVFGLMAAYFGGVARNPVTGNVGHGWSVFKVCKWAFPLVVAIQGAGLYALFRRSPWGGVYTAAVPAAVLYLTWPTHVEHSRLSSSPMLATAESEQPLRAWRYLRERVSAIDPENVYFVSRPEGLWPRSLAAYLLYPRPFVNGWKGNGLLEPYAPADQPGRVTGRTLVLMWGVPPFGERAEKLPGGLSRLSPEQPVIFELSNPNYGVYDVAGRKATWIGTRPARLGVWSPRAGAADLTFFASGGPSRPGDSRRRLTVRTADGSIHEYDYPVLSATPLTIPVALPAGVSEVELSCPDAPTSLTPAPGGAEMLVSFEGPRLTFRQP